MLTTSVIQAAVINPIHIIRHSQRRQLQGKPRSFSFLPCFLTTITWRHVFSTTDHGLVSENVELNPHGILCGTLTDFCLSQNLAL
jgi:hypothetical protein